MASNKYKVLHWLDTGIFPATIMFSCGFTYDEIMGLLKKKKADGWIKGIESEEDIKLLNNDGSWGTAIKRTIENKKKKQSTTLYYIIVKDFDFSDGDYCKLAHEVLHICQFFLPDVLNRDDEHEAEAYLHTYIMQNCLKILRNK